MNKRNPKHSGKICRSASLSTTNPTWTGTGSKPVSVVKTTSAMARPQVRQRCNAFQIINCSSNCNIPETVQAQLMAPLPPGVGALLSNGGKNAYSIASQSACGGEERNSISGLKVMYREIRKYTVKTEK